MSSCPRSLNWQVMVCLDLHAHCLRLVIPQFTYSHGFALIVFSGIIFNLILCIGLYMHVLSVDIDGFRAPELFIQWAILQAWSSWHFCLSHLIHVYLVKFSFLHASFSLL